MMQNWHVNTSSLTDEVILDESVLKIFTSTVGVVLSHIVTKPIQV